MSQTHWLSIWGKDVVAELVNKRDVVVDLVVGKLDPLVDECTLFRSRAEEC